METDIQRPAAEPTVTGNAASVAAAPQRLFFLDVLRVVAILGAIAIHNCLCCTL